jgi:hypothetical protein
MRSPLALLAAAGLLTGAALAGSALAAVQETSPVCMEAHAILAGSTNGDSARVWQGIGAVVRKNRRWQVVGEAERGTVDRVAFKEWRPRWPTKGGPDTLYVAHCGHGGTCNDVAKAIAEAYPQATPQPVVFCGDTSNVLAEPKSVTLP